MKFHDNADHAFQYLVAQGLASAFHPNIFNDDESLEEQVKTFMANSAQEHLSESHDKAVAIHAMGSKTCDIESTLNPTSIESFKDELNLDEVDAAVEIACAVASGLPADSVQHRTDDDDEEEGTSLGILLFVFYLCLCYFNA